MTTSHPVFRLVFAGLCAVLALLAAPGRAQAELAPGYGALPGGVFARWLGAVQRPLPRCGNRTLLPYRGAADSGRCAATATAAR